MNNTPSLEGMTANEQLAHAGLLGAFGAAMRARDAEQAKALLQQAGLSAEQAAFTVTTILAHPKRYGY